MGRGFENRHALCTHVVRNALMRKVGLLILIIGLTGCVSIKVPISDTKNYKVIEDKVTTNEYQIGDNGYLICDVLGIEYINKDSLRTKKIIVKRDERQIQITLNHNNKDITRYFKYKVKTADKELKCKTKTKIGLLPPIVWDIQNESNSICIDSDDNLIIYHHHGGGLFFVFFPFGGASTGQMQGTFKLVEN